MRKAFAGLAAVLLAVIVVQFFLAASGAFDSAPLDEAFRPHRGLGFVTILLAVILTVVAAVAKLPGRIVGLSGLIAGLGVLQPVIAVIARAFGDSGDTTAAGQLVFGLHAVNGLAMAIVAHTVFRQARELAATPPTTRAGSPTAGSAAGPARSAS
ncbi:DUF6220 domain-containing protein [Micromonospora sagamiensis]|uniref:Uncharacterized protein n=1 Tax=Micromonospora sagamiensis TaxID=47875 RepID=A0A562WBY7_9ACTN|nr:DUF6220 domain-containing protein [Micromonospora sagamiensis]TWJ27658.1 hypothetical protein JD81_01149 [Micromonospora sagamiensis]BCL13456.1 hypothetical protein GCM10017556_11950 [Micromonospora sagamiensis]